MNEDQLRAELAAVYTSKSWKITRPLREFVALSTRIRNVLVNPRAGAKAILRRAAQNEAIRKSGARFLNRFPALRARIKRIAILPVSYTLPVQAITQVEMEVIASVAMQEAAIEAAPSEPVKKLSAGTRAVLAGLRTARRQLP